MEMIDVLNAPWAISQEKYAQIRDLYIRHAHGERIDIAAVEAEMGRKLDNKYQAVTIDDGVAVIPIQGVIAKRANLFSQISGGTSSQLLQRDLATAMNDPLVHSILLLVDSPGGEVQGTQEFCAQVFAARGKKPVVAVCEGSMASAAYWIGSAADEVFISSETALVGSIGVVASHTDVSKAEEKQGIKVTEIAAGKYKRIVSEHEPLTTEGRAELQDQVDQIYTIFVKDVARNRNSSVDTVLSDMAEGKVFIGQRAIKAGLVDGVKTASQAVSDLKAARQQLLFPQRSASAANHDGGSNMSTTAVLPADIEATRKLAFDEGFKSGVTTGAEGERKRIQSVEEQALEGHEDLIAKLKFDGKTTGEQAAIQVLAAEKKKLGRIASDLRNDAGRAASHVAAETTTSRDGKDMRLTADMSRDQVTALAKEQWIKNPALSREFTSEAAYIAYQYAVAQGRVRILSTKKAG
jgi:capsid assembly protease